MGSLKEELLKAGLRATPNPKEQNQRKEVPKKKITESAVHQKQRNFCEECQQIHPDVELYHHKNRTTNAEWMCIRCADKLKIADSCRQTAQSDSSLKRLFRREHGATLHPSHFQSNKNKQDPSKNKQDFSRGQGGRRN